MKSLKSLVVGLAMAALVVTSGQVLNAQECYSQDDCAPYECCRSASMTPYVAFGAVAVVAIIAVACQGSGHGSSGHCHSHE